MNAPLPLNRDDEVERLGLLGIAVLQNARSGRWIITDQRLKRVEFRGTYSEAIVAARAFEATRKAEDRA